MELLHASRLRGTISLPGDKSVSHRAVMLGAIADGTTEITNFLEGEDCLSTISCFQNMGIPIEKHDGRVIVRGKGLHGLSAPKGHLDVGNSGTTARLISGILAGQSFASSFTGDSSIRRRPMKRILDPLCAMGAKVSSIHGNGCAPLQFKPSALHAVSYDSPVASAQVKSCILLAGLYADGVTSVTEPALSRNHTELMLSAFGANVKSEGACASIFPDPCLSGQKIDVPGDISSAAYFIAAGILAKDSEILIKNTGVNPTREGILTAIRAMGATVEKLNERTVSGEAVCDLLVTPQQLHGTVIGGSLIPALIDELPLVAIMAAFAEGMTIIKDASELKFKESNRIKTITENLQRMGADVTATGDGMVILGNPERMHGADFDSYADHRIAMAFAVAALALNSPSSMKQAECVSISYPDFYKDLYGLVDPEVKSP